MLLARYTVEIDIPDRSTETDQDTALESLDLLDRYQAFEKVIGNVLRDFTRLDGAKVKVIP